MNAQTRSGLSPETVIEAFEARRTDRKAAIQKLLRKRLGLIVGAVGVVIAYSWDGHRPSPVLLGLVVAGASLLWKQIDLESKVDHLEVQLKQMLPRSPQG